MGEVKRQPVTYRYDALNWEFIKLLAEIAKLAEEKYGSPEQYTNGRLEGEKSPVNHIGEHLRMYIAREPHDHFGGLKHQLAAIAYNAMMEFHYLEHGGPTVTDAFTKKEEPKVDLSPMNAAPEFRGQVCQNTDRDCQCPEHRTEAPASLLSRLFTRN